MHILNSALRISEQAYIRLHVKVQITQCVRIAETEGVDRHVHNAIDKVHMFTHSHVTLQRAIYLIVYACIIHVKFLNRDHTQIPIPTLYYTLTPQS